MKCAYYTFCYFVLTFYSGLYGTIFSVDVDTVQSFDSKFLKAESEQEPISQMLIDTRRINEQQNEEHKHVKAVFSEYQYGGRNDRKVAFGCYW